MIGVVRLRLQKLNFLSTAIEYEFVTPAPNRRISAISCNQMGSRKMKKMAFGLAFIVIAIALQLPAESPAQATSFVYVGNNFTTLNSSSLGKNVTAYFIIAGSVDTSSGALTDPDKILLWSISTGGVSIDSSSGTLHDVSFTFYSGYITQWTFSASSLTGETVGSNGDWTGCAGQGSSCEGSGVDWVSSGNLMNSISDSPSYWSHSAASLPELKGNWVSNTMAYAPSVALGEIDTIAVGSDGTFTGNGFLTNGNYGVVSGAFMKSSSGLLVSFGLPGDTICRTDVNNSVFACTGTLAGVPNLVLGAKQSETYKQDDLAGTWTGNMLAAGQYTSRLRSTLTIDKKGKFIGPQNGNREGKKTVRGVFSLSAGDPDNPGLITCASGCDQYSHFSLALDGGKSVIVGSSTASDGITPQLWVFTKNAASYSLTDLAGTWRLNSLVPGSGARWQRGSVTVDKKGNLTGSFTDSTGSAPTGKNGKLSILSDGSIGCTVPGLPGVMNMDAGKSLIAYSNMPAGNPPEMGILTKDPLNISGSVSTAAAFLSGVTMTLSGSASAKVSTDTNGAYSFGSLQNGKYTVTPGKGGYTFSPKNAAASLAGMDKTGVSFISVPITLSGQITPYSGKKLGTAYYPIVNLTGSAYDYWPPFYTGPDGKYFFEGVPNGVYTVKPVSYAHYNEPSAPDITFSPAQAKVTIGGKSVKNLNFRYKTDSSCSKCH